MSEKTLENPLTTRRSNQKILKEISPSNEYSGLISFRIFWFDLLAVKGFSRVFSDITVQKHQFYGAQLSI